MAAPRDAIEVRDYPGTGPSVALLHGGPGAAGYLSTLARALSPAFHVLEPLQRRSGSAPLTVARHIADLKEVLDGPPRIDPVLLVGHSWGAMLALAFAAAHPERARGLVLVGCGTFDEESRRRFQAARPRDAEHPPGLEWWDAAGYRESWSDMLRLQGEGIYPAAFSAIQAPVLMLHGADDPHPGRLIERSLRVVLPQLEYQELPRSGHYPWLETQTRERFFGALTSWLEATAGRRGARG